MAEQVLLATKGAQILIGHSMGGRVALEAVRRSPDRILGLALLDTGIHARREGEEASRQILVDLAYEQGMAALADRWLPPMMHPDRVADQALMDSLKAMVRRATPGQHTRQIQALLNRPDAHPYLKNITCPTLVMVGRQDQWSPLSQHVQIAEQIPGAELVVVENAGHMSLVERPAETTAALSTWLRDRVLAGLRGTLSNPQPDTIPDNPLFDRRRSLGGYRMNKMAMGLGDPANRAAFLADEQAYLVRFGLSEEERHAVSTRDWRNMVRLGGNIFFILKITAVDPMQMTEIGAHQAGLNHATFMRERLRKEL